MGTSRPTGNLLDILERLTRDVRRIKAKLSGTSTSLNAWPVGSIFITTSTSNPATLIGGGTWESFGEGKVLVGVDDSDTDFDAVEETGGAKTHTHPLSAAGQALIRLAATENHEITMRRVNASSWERTHHYEATGDQVGASTASETTAAALHGNTDADSSLQPYITVHMWKRTA